MRLAAYWGPRGDTATTLASRLYAVQKALEGLSVGFDGWWWWDQARRERVPVDSEAALLAALEAGATQGNTLHDAQTLHVGRRGNERASLDVTFGTGIVPHWRGEGLVLHCRGRRMLRREPLEAALEAAATTLDCDWGFVGSERHPHVPADHDGTPIVGWLTYISKRYGELDNLPDAAAIVPIPGRGSIARAFDELFEDRSVSQWAVISDIAFALKRQGVRKTRHGAPPGVVAQASPAAGAQAEAAELAAAWQRAFSEDADLPEAPRRRERARPAAHLRATAPLVQPEAAEAAPSETPKQKPTLPFVSPPDAKPPARADLTPKLDTGTAGSAPNAGRSPATPFGLDVSVGGMTVVEYAQFCAACTATKDLAALLARHQLTPDSRSALDRQWHEHLSHEPRAKQLWSKKFSEALAALKREAKGK